MVCLYPSNEFAAKRVVDGLAVARGKTPSEQLLLEDKAGVAVSLRDGEPVPLGPPLEIWLVDVIVVLLEHGDGLEDEIEERLRACALQLGFGLLRDPRHKARVEYDCILAKEGAEVELLEGVMAGRSALTATSGSFALSA